MPTASSLPVHADFFADLRDQLAAFLLRDGIGVPPAADADEVCVLYLNAMRRRIEQRQRPVFGSSELRAKTLPTDLLVAVQAIEATSVAGANLNPYLSKQIRNAAYHDMLLNEWGIHHMHLGPPYATPGSFVGRRRELLFVYITTSTLYFIDLLDHEAFEDDQLVDIVHRNWPDVLAEYRQRTAPGRACPRKDREHSRRATPLASDE
jgi:hypothetical protein